MPAPRVRFLLVTALLWAATARADPDPCALDAQVSPCFDADPLWVPTAPGPFVSLPSPRTLGAGEFAALAAFSFAHRPVILVAPSPHRYGREVPVVENTSTLTLGARYGIGYGLDLGFSLPLVPYQNGTGTAGVTAQHASELRTATVRDPRVEFGATLFGRRPGDALSIGTRLTLVLPSGAESALAGYAGPTVAPAVGAALELGRVTLAADFGFRFRTAVNFASVREGSEATVAAGAAFELLEAPQLAVGLEASLRPRIAGPPVGAAPDTLDLPAEWLGSVHFAPAVDSPWSFLAGAGSGLPLSYAAEPGTEREATLGVTAPEFRAVLAVRCVFR